MREHHYKTSVTWTGNTGKGTDSYRGYKRSHTISVEGKEIIFASSDVAFMGDKTKYNPEELFLASLSSCHMLWYLHLCADAGIIVVTYEDNAEAVMIEDEKGGRFTGVTLYPKVTITDSHKTTQANDLHNEAHKQCFIANSCNFPVAHELFCTA